MRVALGIKHPRAFLRKALTLVREHRLMKISPMLYLVNRYHYSLRPSHPQFYVVEREGSKWMYNCPGYASTGFCSHLCAVMILESSQRAKENRHG